MTTETSRHPGDAVTASAGDRIQDAAETAAAVSADDRQDSRGLGRPGPPVNRRSPLFIGMAGAAGVAITYGIVELIAQAGSVLILIGMAFFVAVGLEPVVGWLTRRHLPRWAAVVIVVAGLLGAAVLFAMLAVARLSGEVTSLVQQLPHYVHSLQNHNSELGGSTPSTTSNSACRRCSPATAVPWPAASSRRAKWCSALCRRLWSWQY